MEKKKLIIIGAGVAGLSAGIYGIKAGFDVTIFELNPLPGGECTGWDRGGYHFDGCVHWLAGSKPGSPQHEIWRTTGALDDNTGIINYDIFSKASSGGETVRIFTDAERLREELLRVSPADKKLINSFVNDICTLRDFNIPVDKPFDMMGIRGGISYALRNLKKISTISKYSRLTVEQFSAKFKSPLIRAALNAMMCPVGINANSLVFTLAGMNNGDCGYPVGGSLSMSKRMADKFLSMGGRINYSSPVLSVLTENGVCKGVRTKSGDCLADYTVSCCDAHHTVFDLLQGKYRDKTLDKMFADPKKYYTPISCTVFMGADIDLDIGAHSMAVPQQYRFEGSREDTNAVFLCYHGKKHMAPEGHTVFALFYEADFDYWKGLDRAQYKAAKSRLIEDAKACAEKLAPELMGHITCCDAVTPMTYKRYCNAYRGAWMSFGSGRLPAFMTGRLKGLSNFYLAGIWTQPPGGLPLAAAAGKFVIQRLGSRRDPK